ncbi:uncharacterized protein [Drosophila tropicalis]|uniref:uncharacterized protein n=1 Tax=Drosophila tropicalis TaxID=46794 RepID=UPI0035AC127C
MSMRMTNARQILGSMSNTFIHGRHVVRLYMSKPKAPKVFKQQSATYRIVHASRASAAAQEDMDELEVPVPTPMPVWSTQCLPSRRTEQDQRRISKAQSMEAVKNLFKRKLPKVTRLPFHPMPVPEGKISSRRFSNAEELLKVVDQPKQLANEVISLARELSAEKDKNKKLLDGYHELLEKSMKRVQSQKSKVCTKLN